MFAPDPDSDRYLAVTLQTIIPETGAKFRAPYVQITKFAYTQPDPVIGSIIPTGMISVEIVKFELSSEEAYLRQEEDRKQLFIL